MPHLTAPILLALVLGQMGVHAVMAGLRLAASLQTLREGSSPWAVGLLLALFAAAPVLTAFAAGRMIDRLGYHRPVKLAVVLTMLGAVTAVASRYGGDAGHFVMLCVAAALTGAGANLGMLTIQRAASLVARNSAERVRAFSWLGVAAPLSNVVGPVLVGFVIDAWGFRAAYLTLLLLPMLTLLSVRFVPDMTPVAKPRGGTKVRKSWDLLAVPGMGRLLTVNWLLSMCWDVHLFAVPILSHGRGFSASTVGLIMGCFTATVAAVRLLVPLVSAHMDEVKVLRWAMLAAAGIFAAYPFAPTPAAMAVLALLLGLALGSVQPMVMSMLHHLTPDSRHGESLALRSVVSNTSSTLMPLVFGASGAVLGAGVLFWLVGGVVGAGSWLTRAMSGPSDVETVEKPPVDVP